MAKGINTTFQRGNLTADHKFFPSQADNTKGWVSFTVAVADSKKVGNEWVDDPDFHDCKVYVNNDYLLKRLTKGRKVTVSGRLKKDMYEKDGVKHYPVYIKCETVEVDYVDSDSSFQNSNQGSGNNQNSGYNNQQNNNQSGGYNNKPNNNYQRNNQNNQDYQRSDQGFKQQSGNSYQTGNQGGGYNDGPGGNFEDDIPF